MEKPITNIHFRIMTFVMSVVKSIRNINMEIICSGIKEGDHVLDYGCGPGFVTIPAAKIVGSQGLIYAVDIEPKAIETIKKKIRKNGLNNIKTLLIEEGKGLPDESIDIALLFNVIFMVQDKEKILDELHRILKNDGVISIVNSGLVSKFKSKEVAENQIIDLLTGSKEFMLFEKTGLNFNFIKR